MPAGRTSTAQGEQGDKRYLIKRLEVEVPATGDDGRALRVDARSAMGYFGEIALLRPAITPRHPTAPAKQRTNLHATAIRPRRGARQAAVVPIRTGTSGRPSTRSASPIRPDSTRASQARSNSPAASITSASGSSSRTRSGSTRAA